MLNAYILVLLSVTCTHVHGVSYSSVNNLKRKLLANYTTTTRPIIDQENAIEITTTAMVGSIQAYDMVEEILTSMVKFSISWSDELIRWDPRRHDHVDGLFLPFADVWTPSLSVHNSAEGFDLMENYKDALLVQYTSDGNAKLEFSIRIKTFCGSNAKYFPFDKHLCKIILKPLGSSTEKLKFKTAASEASSDFVPNGLWDISFTDLMVIETIKGNQFLYLDINLKRQARFLIVNIFLPFVFLQLMIFFVFLLPSDCGEKVSFSVTVVLSLAIYMTIVMDQLPPISANLPVVSLYLCISLAINVIICAASTLTVKFCHQSSTKKIPRILQCMATLMNIKECRSSNADGDISRYTCSDEADAISHIDGPREKVEDNGGPVVTWDMVSRSVDRVALILCFGLVILEGIVGCYIVTQ